MLNTKTLSVLLLSTSLLTACGGGSSTTDNNNVPNSGSETETGGGETETTPETNPFANGNIPTTKTEVVAPAALVEEGQLRIIIDPETGKLTLDSIRNGIWNDGVYRYSNVYDYNPQTGDIDIDSAIYLDNGQCRESMGGSDACANVNQLRWMKITNIKDFFKNYKGEGLVLTNDDENIQYNKYSIIGYNPTDANNMPSNGKVTYTGTYSITQNFGGYHTPDISNEDGYVYEYTARHEGTGVTSVDFDNDNMSVDFGKINDEIFESVKIEDIKIEGSAFKGGNLKLNVRDDVHGYEYNYDGDDDDEIFVKTDLEFGTNLGQNGQFFGEEGQELAGSFYGEVGYSEMMGGEIGGSSISEPAIWGTFSGAWTGTRE